MIMIALSAEKALFSIAICQRHVGQHLEDFPLFLLPRPGSDEDEDEGVAN